MCVRYFIYPNPMVYSKRIIEKREGDLCFSIVLNNFLRILSQIPSVFQKNLFDLWRKIMQKCGSKCETNENKVNFHRRIYFLIFIVRENKYIKKKKAMQCN